MYLPWWGLMLIILGALYMGANIAVFYIDCMDKMYY